MFSKILNWNSILEILINFHLQPELGDLETWQENKNAWEEEEDASWQAEEVLR